VTNGYSITLESKLREVGKFGRRLVLNGLAGRELNGGRARDLSCGFGVPVQALNRR